MVQGLILFSRKLMRNAFKMFFFAIMRKKATFLLQRLRTNGNGILKVLAARVHCPYYNTV